MCCSKAVSKCLLFIFNIGFFLFGAAALGVGIFILVDKNQLLDVVSKIPDSNNYNVDDVLNSASFLQTGAYILIAVGAFVFIIAVCGLCGGIRESKCLLTIYAAIVMIILILEVAAGVVCYFYKDDVEKYLMGWLTELVSTKYYGAVLLFNNVPSLSPVDSLGVSDAIDFLQVRMQCCGANNYTDFDSATNWDNQYNITMSDGSSYAIINPVVPISCCKIDNPTAWPSNMETLVFTDIEGCLLDGFANSTNTDSCYTVVKDKLVENSTILIGVGIGVGVAELFGIIAAICLIQIKKKEDGIGSV